MRIVTIISGFLGFLFAVLSIIVTRDWLLGDIPATVFWGLCLFFFGYTIGASVHHALEERSLREKDEKIATLKVEVNRAKDTIEILRNEIARCGGRDEMTVKKQDALNRLVNMPPGDRVEYIKAKLENPETRSEFEAIVKDLVRYGCIRGVDVERPLNNPGVPVLRGSHVEIHRVDYPSVDERSQMDAKTEADAGIEDFIKEVTRAARMGVCP